MAHLVSVSQLGSRDGSTFLNVEEDIHGCIGVWGSSHRTPTYLLTKGIHFYLYQFRDQEIADEWFETEQGVKGWKVTRLTEE